MTRIVPVTAVSGTTTWADVPEGSTVVGLTITSLRLPDTSIVVNTTSVAVLSPVPRIVIAWFGLAEAWPLLAAVPLAAVAVRPVKVSPNALLVPPGVEDQRGPGG